MTTTASTGNTAVQTATKSLLTSLGTGSGIDTGGLVTSLVEAQFATRSAQLTKRAETLTAQISGISTMRGAIAGFATALDALAKSGSLATQPKSSTATVLSATTIAGAKLAGLSSSITVDRLASGQAAVTGAVQTAAATPATRTTVLGSGSFTLQLGAADYATTGGVTSMTGFTPTAGASVSFDLTDASVDTIAAAINAQGAALGITASVVTGADGAAFLSLKGATGAAKAFTLTTTGDPALAQFAVGPSAPMRLTAQAQNAALTVDGVAVERATNSIDDLVAGVKLELATTGSTTLTTTRPTESLTQAVADVADTYNQVIAIIQAQTDPVSGTLASDPAAQALLRSLRGLTLASINPGGAAGEPRTLAELGVKTARDGMLMVDRAAFAKVLAAKPDTVEAMFASSTASTTGLPAMLAKLSASATSPTYGLSASGARYAAAQAALATGQARIVSESEAMTTRLTGQFSAMNARVTAYKSVQTFLTNQIAAWNKSDS